jgi:glyoxylase-like metal-dependent hydrolase (beta-lactamase superfamily II)
MSKRSNAVPSTARRIAALAAVVTLGPASIFAQQNFDNVEVRSLHVQGHVYMLVGAGSNVTISVGDDGVLVVDTQFAGMAPKLLAEIRRIAGTAPIRYIANTHAHPDHIGGNAAIAAAGSQVVDGNFAEQVSFRSGGGKPAFILAHENTLRRITSPAQGAPPPSEAWPTNTFFTGRKDVYFNGEAVILRHQPNAHTDGDIIVHFRGSDVIATGDVYVNNSFPFVDIDAGGTLNGLIDAANRILKITVPADKEEGGTLVVPGHGRLADEADVAEYRDMLTIIRDRMVAMIKDGMTLEQVQKSNVVADYVSRFGCEDCFNPTSRFVENAYRSLTR